MRLFIAILLPEEWIESLSEVQKKIGWLGKGIKWVEPDNLHLTLKFLGETPPSLLPQIEAALSGACKECDPFDMQISGTGTFPDSRRPKVYWAGLKAPRTLLLLQERIANNMHALGFEDDGKTFVPHLTIARIKEPIGKERMTQAVLAYKLSSAPFRADSISLMESMLKQEGPIYREVQRVKLGTP
ncbi:RNA 2',3'-cyclic phosphodiesterase [bacterium]|nr:RNA 2',3'-cyclic phosphodiesterase [bacterium]